MEVHYSSELLINRHINNMKVEYISEVLDNLAIDLSAGSCEDYSDYILNQIEETKQLIMRLV